MKKTVLKAVSLISVLAITLTCAGCSLFDKKPEGLTNPVIKIDATTSAPSSQSQPITTAAVTTSEPTTAPSTNAATSTTEATTEATTAGTTATTVATPESKAPKTDAEIIAYCNDAVNKVKSSGAGFTKKYIMKVNGDVSGLPSWLTGLVNKDETKTYAKGSADIKDQFPAAGFDWSSKLTASDVQSSSLKVDGNNYIISLKLGTEVNPTTGDTSSYGRCMSVIDAGAAKEMVPGGALKEITMTYHDGYLNATIDSTTGNVIECEFSAVADVEAKITLLGNISVKDIVSTETFSDFQW